MFSIRSGRPSGSPRSFHGTLGPKGCCGRVSSLRAAATCRQAAGAELAEAITAYGFGTLGLTRLHATVTASNKASLAPLDGIGFEHVRDVKEDDGSTICVLVRRLNANDKSPLGR
ncbi:GNAT family N-acetyltransferase [Streptomyces sp. NPDC056653]|uniref:GNAT family N-acetyltransferase n=1 Tax=Streptomyces sp. NPDC056653 TaxID=3345894 RepID=UPI0036B1D919